MVDNILPFLIKDSRKVPPNRAPKDADPDEEEDSEDDSENDSDDDSENSFDAVSDSESINDLEMQDETLLVKKADLAKDEVWVSVSFIESEKGETGKKYRARPNI